MKKKSETIELRESIARFIAEKLSAYGFKRKNDIFFIRKYNDDINHQFFYGGNINKYEKKVYFSISVNVEYVTLNQIIKSKLFTNAITKTMCNIGYIMPQKDYKEWMFAVGEDFTNRATDLVNTLILYGLPYLEKLSNKATMIDAIINDPYICRDTKSFLIPVMSYIQGDREFALNYLEHYKELYKASFEKENNNDDCFWDIPSIPIEDKDSINYGIYVENLKKIMAEGKTLE